MQTLRTFWLVRAITVFAALSLVWLQVGPVWAGTVRQSRVDRQNARLRLEAARRASGLAPGLTQTPDAALRRKIEAKERAAAMRPVADVRPLTAEEMQRASGRGPLRNPYFNGTLPWQKSLRDVNLCNGNLFKSFTDIQVAPARGAGLVLQRTYNSNDAREGAFGIGWGHAYDIRIQEAAAVQAESGDPTAVPVQPVSGAAQAGGADTINEVPRTDFFGAKHTYHRDADGLYSPPPYLYDEMSSDYDSALVDGPVKVDDDTEKGMDGTVKHYSSVLTLADGTRGNERGCDSITDRYGNQTTLTYGLSYVQPDGSTRQLLTRVTDPTGRFLTFQWTNFGTAADPHYRITEVDAPPDPHTGAPAYRVVYAYYGANDPLAGGASYQLESVTLDAGDASHLKRTTTYTYTSCAGTYQQGSGSPQTYTECGLLARITDPLGHTVSYTYSSIGCVAKTYDGSGTLTTVPNPTGTVWVSTVTEPAGVDTSGNPRTQTWNIVPTGAVAASGTQYIVSVSNTSGAYFAIGFDSLLRFVQFYVTDLAEAKDLTVYDTSNNVRSVMTIVDGWGREMSNNRADNFTYGQHGNQQAHTVSDGWDENGDPVLFPGVETTTYDNASQYFQKSGQTDMDGHTTAVGVGTDTAGAPGDPDPNTGDRGQTLWVQDAGYNDSSSSSYHKQYAYAYNQYGQKTGETNLNGVTTTYAYGTSGADLGDLIQVVQDPGGAGHLNRTTTMHYDVMGRVLQSVDPKGQESDFAYNSLGQPVTVTSKNADGSVGETITYVYDDNGRTRSVTDSHRTTTMDYEAGSDRVHSVTDSVTGTVSYTYRSSGERLTMTLPGGGTWTYAYTDTENPGANVPFEFQISATDPYQPTLINGFWYMPKDADSLTLLPWSVTDDQGRRIVFAPQHTGEPFVEDTDQVYDARGVRVGYLETFYTYDRGSRDYFTHGWVTRISTTWHGLSASGQPIQRVVSQNDYAYDAMCQRLSNTVSTQPVNADGSGQTDGGGNPVLTSRTERYAYDALNRLKTVDYGDGQTQSYTFDAMGNRTQRQDSAAGTTGYAIDAANRLTGTTGAGAASYTSDADGNTLSDGTRTNTWDSQNRLAGCNAIDSANSSETHHCTYTYGADGLRRSQTVLNELRVSPGGGFQNNGVQGDPGDADDGNQSLGNTTHYAYDGTMLVREMQGTPGSLHPTATYLQGPTGPAYRRDDTQAEGTYTDAGNVTHAANRTRWYVYDGLGSVVGEVDPSGNLTSSGTFDVYGAKRAGGTGTATSRQGFVGGLGHVTDAETGLVYMRARYYDPAVGRFISEDPKRDGNTWFDYCNNNPVNAVDCNGEETTWVNDAWAIAGAAGIGATIGLMLLGVAAGGAAYGTGNALAEGLFHAAEIAAIAAVYCFKSALEGLSVEPEIRGKIQLYEGLTGALLVMMGGFEEGCRLNLPGVAAVMGAVFGYGLVVLGALAADD